MDPKDVPSRQFVVSESVRTIRSHWSFDAFVHDVETSLLLASYPPQAELNCQSVLIWFFVKPVTEVVQHFDSRANDRICLCP
jgi:hypothetical protein